MSAAEVADAITDCSQSMPDIFFCMVVNGMMSVSSWSWPKALFPFAERTPRTRNGMF
jgi:hypothetical protein